MQALESAAPALEVPVCNLCGSSDRELLYVSSDYRYEVDAVPYPVTRCTSCGLGYTCPRPTRDAIGRYYGSNYYAGRDLKAAGERMRDQSGYLGDRVGRLLDIGAARGDFVAYMRSQGWSAVGFEPFVSDAAPLDVPMFEDWDDLEREEFFDVITAWSVFEHMHDPMEGFKRSAGLLRPGGRLVLHVPNLNSVFSRLARQEDVPRHLYFFSERTLRAYGLEVGLELEDVAHDTRIMDGTGTGVLRLWLFRALGLGTREYFRWTRLGRRGRRKAHPAAFYLSIPLAAIERVLLAKPILRGLRLNGYVVATFRRPQ